MKKIYFLTFLLTGVTFAQTNVGVAGNVDGVYINEFHYDNASTDVGEFIEVAGPAGTDLSTYTLTLYNGYGDKAYDTMALSGTIDDEGAGMGAVSFSYPTNGIQNGAPDGIALSKTGSTDVLFLSYVGVMTASDGVAAGISSFDIGVEEGFGTEEGYSLEYDEATMTWYATSDDTPGDLTQGPEFLSTKNFDAISGLKMYPNPVSGSLLNLTSANNTELNVQIFDVSGKTILHTKTINNVVSVAKLNTGVYIVKITDNEKTATRKLVVH